MSLSTIAISCFRLCPGLNPELVKSYIQDSYRELLRMEWNKLNLIANISTIAPYTIGHVSITTLGVVTGVGTAFSSSMVGRWMRLYYSDSLFRVASVGGPTTLTLEQWPGDILAAGQDYTIYKSICSLPSPLTLPDDVVYQTSLPKKSQSYFNQIDPSRLSTGTPLYWAMAGFNSTTRLMEIEIYPLPDAVYPLRVYGKIGFVALGDSDTPYLDEDLIEAHALMKCYRQKIILEPKLGWEQQLTLQQQDYARLLENAQDEDYRLGEHSNRVKDSHAQTYPTDDSFYASHDVD